MSAVAQALGDANATGKARVPAVEGWFTTGDDGREPALVGSRCTACGTYAFPREQLSCRNPRCQCADLEVIELSRRGRVWSYTDARYQPPPPYVPADPYRPFTIAAVELAVEQMVVLGQMLPGATVDDLDVGDEVELVVDTLYEDDEHEYLVWKWRKVAGT
ncbi:MAG: OB-fold domain-containing protein [Actinomycetota bacterium]|nr:OB-fold domain-containing protein [Actinomycetota bacterium]